MADKMSLVAVVDELRRQLDEVNRNAAGGPMFVVRQCEVELGVTVETSGNTGVSLHFFELGGDRSKASSSTVKLTLEPLGELFAPVYDTEGDDGGWAVE